jgi:hypothetical protein
MSRAGIAADKPNEFNSILDNFLLSMEKAQG